MRVKLLILFGMSLFLLSWLEPTATISGKVTDTKNEALIGATILIKGTKTGTNTDFDGRYQLKIKSGKQTIIVNYVGYKTIEKEVELKENENLTLDFKLEDDTGTLSEVVVTAHGKHKKVSKKSEAIKNMPTRAIVGLKPSAALKDDAAAIKGARKESTVYEAGKISLESSSLPPASPSSSEAEVEKKPSVKEEEEMNSTYKKLLDAALDIRAGRVTASENSDFKQWKFWKDNKRNEGVETHQKTWGFHHFNRYPVLVVNEKGFPIPNCNVQLQAKNGRTSWESRTDNLGRAELWASLFEEKETKSDIFINVDYQGITRSVKARKDNEKGVRIVLNTDCQAITKADVCFVIDATGSMGDEIAYLRADLTDVVERVKKANPSLSLNIGSVFYRDKSDDYLTKEFEFSDNTKALMNFWNEQGAGGGGDYEEAVEEGLAKAMSLKWREEAQAKIVFLLLDAPPHQTQETIERMKNLTATYAKKGIKIIPIAASGIDKSTEYLMRFMALATNGTYTYLTDDSGVGDSHIDATVADVSVEFLNNLLTRLINQNVMSATCENSQVALVQKIDNQQNNQQVKLDAKLFPIPAQEQVTIDLSEDVDNIIICSLDGKTVQSIGKKSKGKHQIELTALSSGTYFLQIIKENVMFGQKFIVLNMI